MVFKIVIYLFIAFILYSLGSGLFYLVRDKGNSDRVVKALTWRIALSLFLFILIFFAFWMGWITPRSV